MDQSNNTRDTRYIDLGYTLALMGSNTTGIYRQSSNCQTITCEDDIISNAIEDIPNSIMASDSVTMISQATSNVHDVPLQRGFKRTSNMCYDDNTIESQQIPHQPQSCSRPCVSNENYSNSEDSKKSPPSNGKKTKGRVKIKMEYIDNKLRRYTTFSKRKTGIMKKAYELSTLTGTQVMLLVASETGHVYTFATRKLQPMITSESGKALIQTCLNSPDPPISGVTGDQRMSATGFEETELSYNISDEEQKVRQLVYGTPHSSNMNMGYTNTSGHSSLPHCSTSHTHHTHLITNVHSVSPSTHLVPCSSPTPLLTASPYVQTCPSPLPQTPSPYHQNISHTPNQR
ncbi:unnamed protein product [Trichogramma brassicae]|uniref:Serum response factor homolog n=1 Tax=Trichogramma brassicae TaxID=86971 RepID=A0A6H5I5L8_9HYME|nr:unnamed protein product [Trichogramma brassicae]